MISRDIPPYHLHMNGPKTQKETNVPCDNKRPSIHLTPLKKRAWLCVVK